MGGQQCKAKAKSTGKRCTQRVVPGYEVCFYHGGATPRGVASPHFKHGRYAKVPINLLAAYEASLADPELLSLNQEIALLDARANTVLGRLEVKEAGSWFARLNELWTAMEKARPDPQQVMYFLGQIGDVIQAGAREWEQWGELFSIFEQRRKLAESERRRREAMQTQLNADQAMTLVSALLESVVRNVNDRSTVNRIQAEFIRLTTSTDRLDASG